MHPAEPFVGYVTASRILTVLSMRLGLLRIPETSRGDLLNCVTNFYSYQCE